MIQRTNEGATGYANAAVKRINALEIGQNAVKAWKTAEGNILSMTAAAGGAASTPAAAGAAPAPLALVPQTPPPKNEIASN